MTESRGTHMSLTTQDKQDIQEIVTTVVYGAIDKFAISVNESFQALTDQINGVEHRLDGRIDGLDNQFTVLEEKVDQIDVRLGAVEKTVSSMDHNLISSLARLDDHGVRLTRLEQVTFK